MIRKKAPRSSVSIDNEIREDLKIFAANKRIDMSLAVDIAIVDFMNKYMTLHSHEIKAIQIEKVKFIEPLTIEKVKENKGNTDEAESI
jgi:hypothetical protein